MVPSMHVTHAARARAATTAHLFIIMCNSHGGGGSGTAECIIRSCIMHKVQARAQQNRRVECVVFVQHWGMGGEMEFWIEACWFGVDWLLLDSAALCSATCCESFMRQARLRSTRNSTCGTLAGRVCNSLAILTNIMW